jgi:hypothetical protein
LGAHREQAIDEKPAESCTINGPLRVRGKVFSEYPRRVPALMAGEVMAFSYEWVCIFYRPIKVVPQIFSLSFLEGQAFFIANKKGSEKT